MAQNRRLSEFSQFTTHKRYISFKTHNTLHIEYNTGFCIPKYITRENQLQVLRLGRFQL